MVLLIWPQCLQSTVSEVEQSRIIESALQHSSSVHIAIKLGLASSHPQLAFTATDALVEQVKRDGAKAVEAVLADKELLAALVRPDLLPRLANTRLYPAVCQQLVKAIQQQGDASALKQQPHRPSHHRALPAVLQCPICQSQLSAATEADIVRTATSDPVTSTTLLPLSLAHLVSHRLYPQAAHLVYSVLQTHEYMRSLPAGLAQVHARLKAASRDSAASVNEEGAREHLQLYESALGRMKDDGVAQSR